MDSLRIVSIEGEFQLNGGKNSQGKGSGKGTPKIILKVSLKLTTIIAVLSFIVHAFTYDPILDLKRYGTAFPKSTTEEIKYKDVFILFLHDPSGFEQNIQSSINYHYSRQGLCFSGASGYEGYFYQYSWYKPNHEISEASAYSQMTYIEQRNVDFLAKIREIIKLL